jgi:hypothetical protein
MMAVALGGCQKGEADRSRTEGGKAKAMEAGGGQHLGDPFKVAERTEIAAVVANPKSFEGKTIRISGVVQGFCHHQRAWFSLSPKVGDKQIIRVITRPKFSTPEQIALNQAVAEAEGTVQLKTVDEAYAKHMAKEHGLFGGEPDKIQGPQYSVNLVATGARF